MQCADASPGITLGSKFMSFTASPRPRLFQTVDPSTMFVRPIRPTILANDGKHEFVEMRWGLVPFWWSKPLKELRLATFNARVETETTMPFFRANWASSPILVSVQSFDRSRSATRRAISAGASSGIGNTELTLISPST